MKTRILASLLLATAATALSGQSGDPLQQILEQVRQSSGALSRANEERLAAFRAANARQAELLRAAQAELAATERRSEELKSTYDRNEQLLSELETRLKAELGDMGEVFGIVRQNAGDLRANLESSIVSVQIPGRDAFLGTLAESKALPEIESLEQLWYELQREITESGRVVNFDATVLLPSGEKSNQTVTRIGVFTAVSKGAFVELDLDTGSLYTLPRQPAARFLEAAAGLGGATSGFPTAVVDPSRGSIMGAFSKAPNFKERLDQGKTVGYVIVVLGIIGALLSAWRLIALTIVGAKMRAQLKNPTPNPNNPVGRVMAVFAQYNTPDTDLETLELKLDEAILKETPAFERALPTIKILAAVAPLLGLLGTVTGMIGTFQAITLFGTGDPKIMAGGISEALVTTVEGLVVSIPLVLIHSVLSGKAEQYTQLLDEQSAGLTAEFAEQRRGHAA